MNRKTKSVEKTYLTFMIILILVLFSYFRVPAKAYSVNLISVTPVQQGKSN